jgi:hypothetical protein
MVKDIHAISEVRRDLSVTVVRAEDSNMLVRPSKTSDMKHCT